MIKSLLLRFLSSILCQIFLAMSLVAGKPKMKISQHTKEASDQNQNTYHDRDGDDSWHHCDGSLRVTMAVTALKWVLFHVLMIFETL